MNNIVKTKMTTQELIQSIVDNETEDGPTVVIQDTMLRSYLNQVARSAVDEERQKNMKVVNQVAKLGV